MTSAPYAHFPTIALQYEVLEPTTRRKASSRVSIHCPCLGRMGGPSKVFRATRGMLPCMSRLCAVSSQRSISGQSCGSAKCSGIKVRAASSLVCRTCWLIRRMAMSFRSTVKRSNAASMALFSVLLSTTRKFFWESGGCVTCYSKC